MRILSIGLLALVLGCTEKAAPPRVIEIAKVPEAASAGAAAPVVPDRPIRVGDVIEQYRHFDVDAFIDGQHEDQVGTKWKVLSISDDCIGIRLVEGRYKWVGGQPDKLPGYESRFCASDNYKKKFPNRLGKQQTLEEYRVVTHD